MSNENHDGIEAPEEQLSDEKFEGMEIPEDLMDAIAGGWLNDASRDKLKQMAATAKHNGNELWEYQRFIKHIVRGSGIGYHEACDYLAEIWPSL